MRAFAATLRQVADRIAHVANRASQTAANAGYEGPHATRFRAAIATLAKREVGAAQQFTDLAGRVSRAAGQVEAAQAAERRRIEQEAEQRRLEAEHQRAGEQP